MMSKQTPSELDLDWQTSAACLGLDSDIFYVKLGVNANRAKAVCAFCAVKKECLDFALSIGENRGVWGGLTPKERRTYRGVK